MSIGCVGSSSSERLGNALIKALSSKESDRDQHDHRHERSNDSRDDGSGDDAKQGRVVEEGK